MTDLAARAWDAITERPDGLALPLGAGGVFALWQNLGPQWVGMAMLLGGIGWYVYWEEFAGERDTGDDPEPDPEPEPDPDAIVETGSRDLGEFDVPEGEAPWWDTSAYPTTQERIEAMKRQDPDYDDGGDENLLDKFARVLSGEGSRLLHSDAETNRTSDDEDARGPDKDGAEDKAGLLDDLDPLFDEAGSLEADMEGGGGLEADLDIGGDLEADLEDDAR